MNEWMIDWVELIDNQWMIEICSVETKNEKVKGLLDSTFSLHKTQYNNDPNVHRLHWKIKLTSLLLETIRLPCEPYRGLVFWASLTLYAFQIGLDRWKFYVR